LAAQRKAAHIVSNRIYTLIARIRFAVHGAVIGKRFSVHGRFNLIVHHKGRITIGDDVRLKSGFVHNPVGGSQRLGLWIGKDAHLQIADRVGMSNCTVVCMNRVVIGAGAFIGGGVSIFDTDFHSTNPQLRQMRPDPGVRTAPVTIGPDTFIGGHSIILKGVHIGAGAVVGAGSVVRSDIPANEIWGGNPARYLARLQPDTRPELSGQSTLSV
jgi:acetyltransferase-like isoleucine patch superfamily enzyme